MRACLVVFALVAVTAAFSGTANAGKYQVLYLFGGVADGGNPQGSLIPDATGNLYGTTFSGGDESACGGQGCGTVFKLTPEGAKIILHNFAGGNDGQNPRSELMRGRHGNLYGTTTAGGTGTDPSCVFGCGTIFKITPDGLESVIYSFKDGSDGALPWAGLIEDAAGNFYGTTFWGGGEGCQGYGCGTVFKLTASGTETVLYAFREHPDAHSPVSGLVRDSQGNLFGTAGGGDTENGAVFKVAPNGTESVLYSFKGGSDGWAPTGGLMLDEQGNLFGTTEFGGGNNNCSTQGCGTLFKISVSGKESVIYGFDGTNDGAFPFDRLIADQKGNFYGTTSEFGAFSRGTVFKFTSRGVLKTLHAFGSVENDGSGPVASLLMRKGHLYGMTPNISGVCGGGSCGAIFEVKK